MKLDFRKDFKKIYKHVEERVRDYPEYVNQDPGNDEDPVSQITIGYQFDQAGWIALVFDTRPKPEPDGHWNDFIEENAVAFAHWFKAFDDLCENGSSLVITRQDGSKVTIDSDWEMEDVAAQFGELLRDVLIAARDKGGFAKLPLAKRCIMGVEEHDGAYGWPVYEKRLKEGRVN